MRTVNRFTEEDDQAVIIAVTDTCRTEARLNRWPYLTDAVRIDRTRALLIATGAGAIGCGLAALRPSELEWIADQVAWIMAQTTDAVNAGQLP